MKKLVVLILAIFCVTSMAYAWPWTKKGTEEAKTKQTEVKGKKMVAKGKIATAADLTKALKEGPKKAMHKALTDDDLKAAAAALKLK